MAFDGSTAAKTAASTQGIDFNKWRGAFLIGNKVFYGYYTDKYLYSRTFDGTTFGPAVKIDPYHDPAWSNVQTGDGDTFAGALPKFYTIIRRLTGMVYASGKVYYTLSGDAHLYAAWFSPDSGVIDQTITTVPSSVDLTQADGLFVAGGNLYFGSTTDGSLSRVAFDPATGVTGSATVVSGPSVDGVNWTNNALFLAAPSGVVNQPPTASFTSACSQLTCGFRSSSTDPDGTIASATWNFGDGDQRCRRLARAQLLRAGAVHRHAHRHRQRRGDGVDQQPGQRQRHGAEQRDQVRRRRHFRRRQHRDQDRDGARRGAARSGGAAVPRLAVRDQLVPAGRLDPGGHLDGELVGDHGVDQDAGRPGIPAAPSRSATVRRRTPP